ncbi:hypothetical protein VU08_02550 [Desulfobulbus sp. F5]|nr:hypothetical protein [Desulfobulbus sp. F5]
MNWMQFTIEFIDKMVWPAIVLFFFISLRCPLTSLILRATKLKVKDYFEFEFSQELKAVKKQAEGAFPELKQDRKSILIASVESLPNSAVLDAWKIVDEAAEALIKTKRSDINLDINTRYKLIENILVKGNIIDAKKGALFNDLRQLRNKVAHAAGYEVGKAEAIQYINLCFKLSEHLNALTSELSRHS